MTLTKEFDSKLAPAASWSHGHDPYTREEVREIVRSLSGPPAEGYGPRFVTNKGFCWGNHLLLPPGFDASNVSGEVPQGDKDRPTVEVGILWQVPDGVQEWAMSRGWTIDQHGRPTHPHGKQLLAQPGIGLNVGLGQGRYFGENAVVYVVVTSGDDLLVTQSTDGDRLVPALPGGEITPEDCGRSVAQWMSGSRPLERSYIFIAARRRLVAATGVTVPRDARVHIVRAIRPVTPLTTINSWTVEFTVHVALRGLRASELPSGARLVRPDQRIGVFDAMSPDHFSAVAAALD